SSLFCVSDPLKDATRFCLLLIWRWLCLLPAATVLVSIPMLSRLVSLASSPRPGVPMSRCFKTNRLVVVGGVKYMSARSSHNPTSSLPGSSALCHLSSASSTSCSHHPAPTLAYCAFVPSPFSLPATPTR
ncbi:hypothetical protein V8D89_000049, partial [Ganoderma adspersum]